MLCGVVPSAIELLFPYQIKFFSIHMIWYLCLALVKPNTNAWQLSHKKILVNTIYTYFDRMKFRFMESRLIFTMHMCIEKERWIVQAWFSYFVCISSHLPVHSITVYVILYTDWHEVKILLNTEYAIKQSHWKYFYLNSPVDDPMHVSSVGPFVYIPAHVFVRLSKFRIWYDIVYSVNVI